MHRQNVNRYFYTVADQFWLLQTRQKAPAKEHKPRGDGYVNDGKPWNKAAERHCGVPQGLEYIVDNIQVSQGNGHPYAGRGGPSVQTVYTPSSAHSKALNSHCCQTTRGPPSQSETLTIIESAEECIHVCISGRLREHSKLQFLTDTIDLTASHRAGLAPICRAPWPVERRPVCTRKPWGTP